MSMRQLSKTFRSVKPNPPKASTTTPKPTSSISKSRSWCVYLILSTNSPIKTYVGVTNNFPRRLKQHNGELSGGAKASRTGRPWVCACLIEGFKEKSEACVFESKWKTLSRQLPRKRKNDDVMKDSGDASHQLLQHRGLALNRVKEVLHVRNPARLLCLLQRDAETSIMCRKGEEKFFIGKLFCILKPVQETFTASVLRF